MKFHVASRGGGGTINFGFPAGGHVKIPNFFIFASAKDIVLLWLLYYYNFYHTDLDRKLID